MAAVSIAPPIHQLSLSRNNQTHSHFNPHNTISTRWVQKHCTIPRCCHTGVDGASARSEKNYYELLGVSVDSNKQEIKEAYRNLQKKYHPDIAGRKGHEHTLMLNEAYKVLMREELRRDYDASIGHIRMNYGGNFSNIKGYSSWEGPLRPQALFVDGNACVGCRECVHHASKTFIMDETFGCARVKVQYGDDEHKLEVAVESCPVNCIHWVEREELGVLEFLIQPKQKEGYGVFGQGWERPNNVFMEAKSFNKMLKREAEHHGCNSRRATVAEEETPAQSEAKYNAAMKIRMGIFSTVWDFVKNNIFLFKSYTQS